MNRTVCMFQRALAILWVAVFSACASQPPAQKFVPVQDMGGPAWVVQGPAAFPKSRSFYGVGSAVGIRNQALLITTADNRARAALADTFDIFIKKLYKDYQESATTGDMSKTAETQYIEQALKNITNVTLRGSTIEDHWQNPNTGEMFSLAKLPLDELKKNVAHSEYLPPEVRPQLEAQAEKSYETFDPTDSWYRSQ